MIRPFRNWLLGLLALAAFCGQGSASDPGLKTDTLFRVPFLGSDSKDLAAVARVEVVSGVPMLHVRYKEVSASDSLDALWSTQDLYYKLDRQPTPTPIPPPPVPPTPTTLRVLFLYESQDLGKMPVSQASILTSQVVRGYLDKHCPVESCCPDGKCPLTIFGGLLAASTPSYRFFDKDIAGDKLPKVWQDTLAYAKAKASVPYLLICGTAGPVWEGPWPADDSATLELLKKYGGN